MVAGLIREDADGFPVCSQQIAAGPIVVAIDLNVAVGTMEDFVATQVGMPPPTCGIAASARCPRFPGV